MDEPGLGVQKRATRAMSPAAAASWIGWWPRLDWPARVGRKGPGTESMNLLLTTLFSCPRFLNSARADAAGSGCRRGRLDPPRSRTGVTIRSRPSPDARVAQPGARPAPRGDRIRSPWTVRARYAMHVLSTEVHAVVPIRFTDASIIFRFTGLRVHGIPSSWNPRAQIACSPASAKLPGICFGVSRRRQ